MIKECKEYFNNLIVSLESTSRKNKITAFIFTLILGLLSSSFIVCLYLNLFMQIIGLKLAMIVTIISCGIVLHMIISLFTPIYYICLNELCNDENKKSISYKKLFISIVTDWFMICFIIICVIALVIVVNIVLF